MSDPVTHYRRRKAADGAPAGGPLCGDRQEEDAIARSWAEVDCRRCLDARHAPAPEPAQEPAPEPERPWKAPGEVPPVLIDLCKQPPLIVCARLGKLPPVDAIDAWAAQTAVVLDHYLGDLPSHPLVAWVVVTVYLGQAIARAEPVPAEGAA